MDLCRIPNVLCYLFIYMLEFSREKQALKQGGFITVVEDIHTRGVTEIFVPFLSHNIK